MTLVLDTMSGCGQLRLRRSWGGGETDRRKLCGGSSTGETIGGSAAVKGERREATRLSVVLRSEIVIVLTRLCLGSNLGLNFSRSSRFPEDAVRGCERFGQNDLHLQHVDVGYAIALEAYTLPNPFHRDPVDRILVATARSYQATLLTADERILVYSHVRTRDCRT